MQVHTSGWKSSEFILMVLGIAMIVFLVVAENALGWNINPSIYTLLVGLFGGKAVYAGGRAYFKGKKAQAIAQLGSNGSGEKILERLGAFVLDKVEDAQPGPTPKKKKKP